MRFKQIKYLIVFAFLFSVTKFSFANPDSTCVADFTYEVYQELGKPSVIQFTNTSEGNPTEFSWNFGDGSISSLKDPLHYFPENDTFTVRLMVANNFSSDQISKEIIIDVPLILDFNFKLDSNNVVPNTFIFETAIEGFYDHLLWNFGDQILNDVADTVHNYLEEDKDYQVSLKAEYYFNDTSKMTKVLVKGLTTSEYFDLGGQVYLNDKIMNNPISQGDTGIVYLYRMNNEQLIAVDTNRFTKLGYYWFNKKLKAHYVAHIALSDGSKNANSFAPTYVGNTTYWDEAEIINLSQNKYREDVVMVEINTTDKGSHTISGSVEELISTQWKEEVFVYLFNTEDQLIDYQVSKNGADYYFENLESGHYMLGADVAGVDSKPILVFIEENKTNEFKSLQIEEQVKVFPNPARDYCLLHYNNSLNKSSLEIRIFNAQSQLLKTQLFELHESSNYLHIQLSDLPAGMLFIQSSDASSEVIKVLHY